MSLWANAGRRNPTDEFADTMRDALLRMEYVWLEDEDQAA